MLAWLAVFLQEIRQKQMSYMCDRTAMNSAGVNWSMWDNELHHQNGEIGSFYCRCPQQPAISTGFKSYKINRRTIAIYQALVMPDEWYLEEQKKANLHQSIIVSSSLLLLPHSPLKTHSDISMFAFGVQGYTVIQTNKPPQFAVDISIQQPLHD